MSWAETKKINGNLSKSLDTLITEKTNNIISKIGFELVSTGTLDSSVQYLGTTYYLKEFSGFNGFLFIASQSFDIDVYIASSLSKPNQNTEFGGFLMPCSSTVSSIFVPTLIPLSSNRSLVISSTSAEAVARIRWRLYRFGGGS